MNAPALQHTIPWLRPVNSHPIGCRGGELIDFGKASMVTMGQKPGFFPEPGSDPMDLDSFLE